MWMRAAGVGSVACVCVGKLGKDWVFGFGRLRVEGGRSGHGERMPVGVVCGLDEMLRKDWRMCMYASVNPCAECMHVNNNNTHTHAHKHTCVCAWRVR